MLASAPLIGALLEGLVASILASNTYALEQALLNNDYWYITLIINISFAVMDEIKLKQAGIDTTSFGKVVFLIPVYMWMRAKSLNQKPIYFWVWIALFIVVIL